MLIWVQRKLKERNMSQADLAKELGITLRSLRNKFAGKQPWLYGEVTQICKIFDITNPLEFLWVEE